MHLQKLALVAATALAAACGREATPAAPLYGVATPARTAEVPANTTFRVTMNDTLSSAVSYPGQTFSATLITPLISSDLRVAAPTGAQVNGHVVAVQSGREPRVAVAFDSIETRIGTFRIEAHANEAFDAPFAMAPSREPEEADADAVFRPGGGAIGGGPLPEDMEEGRTTMVVIPKSSELELVLTSPVTTVQLLSR
jgi:hypothetical protein